MLRRSYHLVLAVAGVATMASLLVAVGCGSQDGAVNSSAGAGGASGGENTADLCDDQIDNDADGKTDCDDAECKVAFFDTLCSGAGTGGAAGSGSGGSGSEGVPEDDTLQDPSGVDTSDLDPLSGDVGGSGLTCIAYSTPGTVITQGQHLSSKAIDIDCAIGDPLTNPFPVQAKVVARVTQYADRKCYTSMAQYDAQCNGLNACNNLIKLQTTVAGVTWTANLLHISSSDLSVGDVVPAFGVVGQCGNVGWTCSQGGDGSHLHLSLYHGDPAAGYVYPGTLLSTDCKVLTGSCAGVVCNTPGICHASPGTCTDGLCAYSPSAPGTACTDGDACTSGDACDGSGTCSGTPMPCNNPPSQCYASPGACSGGTCSYSPKASGTPCDDAQACTSNDQCDGLGNCSGSGTCEVCDGIDNDLNGKIDDLPACWKAVYRFLDPVTGARCLGPTPGSPPSQCASYAQEIEAFIVRTNPVANTFEGRQCSKSTDHIIVPMGSADYNALLGAGYDCSLSLGYFYNAGTAPLSGQTPWTNTCRLWRFSYSASGSGAHLFTRGADNLAGMTCEPPARADVFSNFSCFAGTPSGC